MQVDPVRPPFGQCLGWVSSPWSGVTAVTRYSINALQVISPLEKLPTFDICILYTNSCTYSKIRAIPAQKGLESIYIYIPWSQLPLFPAGIRNGYINFTDISIILILSWESKIRLHGAQANPSSPVHIHHNLFGRLYRKKVSTITLPKTSIDPENGTLV